MKQVFEVDWQGGRVSEQLIQSLLWEYLGKFGGVQAGVSVVEVAAQQLAEADRAERYALLDEFWRAHEDVDQGLVDFDLTNTAVDRLHRATRALWAREKDHGATTANAPAA